MVATQFNDATFAMYFSSLWGGGGGAGSVEGRVGYKSSLKSLTCLMARIANEKGFIAV